MKVVSIDTEMHAVKNWDAIHAVIYHTLHAHVLTHSVFACEFETKFKEYICRIFYPEDSGSSFLQNIVTDPKYIASYSKVHHSIHYFSDPVTCVCVVIYFVH